MSTEGTMGMVGTRLWARARAWESMPLASSKPRTSLRHACNNQAQVSSRSSPGGVPRLFEHLLEAAQPMSQEKLTVLKALGDREGSNVDLRCSASWLDEAAGKAGAERRRAADAADDRQVDVPHLSLVRIEPKMVASAKACPRGRHVQQERRHGCALALECCSRRL